MKTNIRSELKAAFREMAASMTQEDFENASDLIIAVGDKCFTHVELCEEIEKESEYGLRFLSPLEESIAEGHMSLEDAVNAIALRP
jgi:hypothetical protein